jgi:outer membrane immunogenic protein
MRAVLGIIIAIAICGSVSAEELSSSFEQQYFDPLTYRWSGFYVGVNGGGAIGKSNWTSPGLANTGMSPNGFFGGGTIGYNYQIDRFVLGIVGDAAWANFKGDTTSIGCPLGCETSTNWFSTFRGRIGYSFDRFMPFITGGAALTNISARVTTKSGHTDFSTGWAVGAGFEYALTDNWIGSFEALYLDFGSIDCTASDCGTILNVNVPLNMGVIRFGLTYKFPVPSAVGTAELRPPKRPCDPDDPGPRCGTLFAKKSPKGPQKRPDSEVKGLVNTSMAQ